MTTVCGTQQTPPCSFSIEQGGSVLTTSEKLVSFICNFSGGRYCVLCVKKQEGQWWGLDCSQGYRIAIDFTEYQSIKDTLIDGTLEHFITIWPSDDRESRLSYVVCPENERISPIQNISGMLIQMSNLTCLIRKKKKLAGIEDVNLEIHPAEFVGIYGESGIGKSILIKQFFNTSFKSIRSGIILLNGKETDTYKKNEIAYFPQTIQIPQQLTAEEFLRIANADRGNNANFLRTHLDGILESCALDSKILSQKVSELSGGEKRRLGLAATLLNQNLKLLIADEPTTGLDPINEQLVMRELRHISRCGITVLTVTHSHNSAILMDRIVVLYKEDNTHATKVIFNGQLQGEDTPKQLMQILAGKNMGNHSQYLSLKSHTTENSIPKCQSRVTSRQHFCSQFYEWTASSFKLLSRDWKGLGVFLLLTFACLAAILVSVCNYGGNNKENVQLTLCVLASPWLCAMYAAVFLSEFKDFYHWEHLSGLRPSSFLGGIIASLLLPTFLVSLIFTIGLFIAPDCDALVRSGLGKLICSFPEADKVETYTAEDWKHYFSQENDEDILKLFQNVHASYRHDLMDIIGKTLAKVVNENPNRNYDALLTAIQAKCPGVQFEKDKTTDDEVIFFLHFCDISNWKFNIPFAPKGFSLREGYTDENLMEKYKSFAEIIPTRIFWRKKIKGRFNEVTDQEIKETIDYLYDHRQKELLIYVLRLLSDKYATDHEKISKITVDCPGLTTVCEDNTCRIDIISWKNAPLSNDFVSFFQGKNPHIHTNNVLLRYVFNARFYFIKCPMYNLLEDISEGNDNNYPVFSVKKGEAPCLGIHLFASILVRLWFVTLLGSLLGLVGTSILGKAREATVFVLVFFVVFILFSRIFISSPHAVSFLQPLGELMDNHKYLPFADSGSTISIFVSFICFGRYASNIIAYCLTNANLYYEYGVLSIMGLLCLLISLIYLRRGKFADFN